MTQDKEYKSITLATLANGAAEEGFAEKLRKVIENIEDPNTRAQSKREIVVTVTFAPSEERDACAVALTVDAKLAPTKPVATTVFIGRDKGVLVALENNPKQLGLFNDEPARPVAVADLPARQE